MEKGIREKSQENGINGKLLINLHYKCKDLRKEIEKGKKNWKNEVVEIGKR